MAVDFRRQCHTVVMFRRYATFRFMAVATLVEVLKPQYGGKNSAVMPYGGNFSAVSGCSFFDGNVNGN